VVELFAHLQTFCLLVLVRFVGTFTFVRLFTPFSAISQSILLQSVLGFGLVLPLVPDVLVSLPQTADLQWPDFILQSIVELAAGAAFAVLCSVPIRIAASIGELIDNSRGLSANGPQNPVTRDEATPLSSAVTVVLSLLIFTFDWHLDVLDQFYGLVPSADLRAVGASLQGLAPIWMHSTGTLGVLLIRVLPLLGLLLAVDISLAIATKNLKSNDMGGAETTLKVLIVATWVVFVLQQALSPRGLVTLRAAFAAAVAPVRSIF